MDFTPEQIMEFIYNGVTPDVIQERTHLSTDQIYSKIEEYQIQYGNIGNIGAIIRKARSSERIVELYLSGKMIGEIAEEKGMSPSAVIEKIKSYERKTGEKVLPSDFKQSSFKKVQEPKKKETTKILSREEIIAFVIDLFSHQGKNATEIDAAFKAKGYKNISINFIKQVIADYIQSTSIQGKIPIQPKRKEIKTDSEHGDDWIDQEMFKLFAEGKTMVQWCSDPQNKKHLEKMTERINLLRGVVEKAYRTDDGAIPDKEFLEIFRIMLNPTMKNTAQQYMFYIEKEGIRPGGYGDYGKISNIKYKFLDGNPDLTCYAILGLDLKFRNGSIDQGSWNLLYNKYVGKVKRYISIMRSNEKNKKNETNVNLRNANNLSDPEDPDIT